MRALKKYSHKLVAFLSIVPRCITAPIFVWNHTRYFQLTLGRERAEEGEAAANRSINHETTSPTLPGSYHLPHTHSHTRTRPHYLTGGFGHIHGSPGQTEPIILGEAMRSLMSSINSNHSICHDGDVFLCLFALITGRSDC